jgi:hypothetical protein
MWYRSWPTGSRQPATASFLRRPGAQSFTAFKLDVLTVVDGQVAAVVTFDAARFGDFGLPDVWTDDLRTQTASVLEGGDDR